MHSARKRPDRPLNHPASAMPPPTKTIPAVRDEPTPANPDHQPRNIASVQAYLPDPHKAPPARRPCGPPATLPNPPQAARHSTVRPALRPRGPPRPTAQLHRDPTSCSRRASTKLGCPCIDAMHASRKRQAVAKRQRCRGATDSGPCPETRGLRGLRPRAPPFENPPRTLVSGLCRGGVLRAHR